MANTLSKEGAKYNICCNSIVPHSLVSLRTSCLLVGGNISLLHCLSQVAKLFNPKHVAPYRSLPAVLIMGHQRWSNTREREIKICTIDWLDGQDR